MVTESRMPNETSPLQERLGNTGGSEETSSATPRQVDPGCDLDLAGVDFPGYRRGYLMILLSRPHMSEGLQDNGGESKLGEPLIFEYLKELSL